MTLFVILLLLNIFIGTDFAPAVDSPIRRKLIHRNYYWYTKEKEERIQNRSLPLAVDHLPPQSALCVILHKTSSCDEIIQALKRYEEYVHTEKFI